MWGYNYYSSGQNMKRKSNTAMNASNAALAIMFTGAAIVAPAIAQDASKPTPGAALQYVGADTRVGIGYDTETKLRGEVFSVLRSDDKSATLAEIWASRHVGGAKLSQHWTSGSTTVNKLFIAADQSSADMRKATVGAGQEYEQWFWNGYLSKGLSSAHQVSSASVSNILTQSGTETGRPYVEDVTTTVTSRGYERPYDWGIGARAGHFYEASLLRVTAGLDYEWGKFSSRQWTGTLLAEKFFSGSPVSVAISGELHRRSGDFSGNRNDQRAFFMLRYELGAPKTSFRPSKITRTVTTTERVPDPDWKAPIMVAPPAVAAAVVSQPTAAVESTTRMEKRTIRMQSDDAQESYFDLGSAQLKPAAQRELDALVTRIKAQQPYVELRVNVVGHTCPTGSDRNNFPLSAKRADAVKAYLVSRGIAAESIAASGKAGKSPKYPEVKGQSFRNRRADTDVIVLKEKIDEVKITIPGTPAGVAVAAPPPVPAAAPAPVAVAPLIDRKVTREIVEDVPNNWISRALHNPATHKTIVDGYRWVETSSAQTTGTRRYINRAPVAANDAYTVDCAAPIPFNVLVNDTDPDGDALTITSVTTPGKGTAVISNGRIVYTPSSTTCGGTTDTFSYTVSDGKGGTATATVAVTINNTLPPPPPPPAPTPPAPPAPTPPAPPAPTPPAPPAPTPPAPPAPTPPAPPAPTPPAPPAPTPPAPPAPTPPAPPAPTPPAPPAPTPPAPPPPAANNAPVAVNDRFIVYCSRGSTLDVLANDSDKDGDALTITSITQPNKAIVTIAPGGKSLIYAPGATCFASDSFTYTISDGRGGTAVASVTLIDP